MWFSSIQREATPFLSCGSWTLPSRWYHPHIENSYVGCIRHIIILSHFNRTHFNRGMAKMIKHGFWKKDGVFVFVFYTLITPYLTSYAIRIVSIPNTSTILSFSRHGDPESKPKKISRWKVWWHTPTLWCSIPSTIWACFLVLTCLTRACRLHR